MRRRGACAGPFSLAAGNTWDRNPCLRTGTAHTATVTAVNNVGKLPATSWLRAAPGRVDGARRPRPGVGATWPRGVHLGLRGMAACGRCVGAVYYIQIRGRWPLSLHSQPYYRSCRRNPGINPHSSWSATLKAGPSSNVCDRSSIPAIPHKCVCVCVCVCE